MKSTRKRQHSILFWWAIFALLLAVTARNRRTLERLIGIAPHQNERPYGMAPVAYAAFLQACYDSKVHPYRIGQTIGNATLSVGYHKKDGVLVVHGQRIDYCAAVDLGADDLDRAGINRLLHNLTKRGFACWYREKGKWQGIEHIHAIYAQLPMKPQLRGQVRLFLRERRARKLRPLPWERRVFRVNRHDSSVPLR